jgi:glycerol-3-phosphate dehydrogenase
MASRGRGHTAPVSSSGGGGQPTYDVAIVGAGVVGAAVARLLSHHRLRVVLIEGDTDVGAGTSKANTAILHTGFDATPGTVEARLVAHGYGLLRDHASEVGIAVEPVGAVLVAWDDEQAERLPELAAKAATNDYARTAIVGAATVYDLEPNLGPGAVAGLLVPDEHIIDPWSTTLAFAIEAVANGVELRRSSPVLAIAPADEGHLLRVPDGELQARFLINAAGLRADDLHRALGHDTFTVTPRRGELIVFDKLARPLLGRTVLPVPTATTKGVLVAPTVFGNVMLGPTADDIADKDATGSTRSGIDRLLAQGQRIMPRLLDEEVTAIYAGLRAATEHGDYVIELHAEQRYVCLGGIRSTGLTASMAIAEEALGLLVAAGLEGRAKDADELVPVTMPNLGEAFPRPYQAGGPIVCHCERVTADEVTGACAGLVPALDLDGVRRRTRALTGRCQGFACSATVLGLASAGTGRSPARLVGLAP